MEDKRGLEGSYDEFDRLRFEDSARSSASAVLREIKRGYGLDAGPQSPLPPNSGNKQKYVAGAYSSPFLHKRGQGSWDGYQRRNTLDHDETRPLVNQARAIATLIEHTLERH